MLAVMVGATALALGCSPAPPRAVPTPTLTSKERKQLPTATPLPGIPESPGAVMPRTSVYLDGLKTPVGFVFATYGRMLFREDFSGNV